jgi:hypothetical protein
LGREFRRRGGSTELREVIRRCERSCFCPFLYDLLGRREGMEGL